MPNTKTLLQKSILGIIFRKEGANLEKYLQ